MDLIFEAILFISKRVLFAKTSMDFTLFLHAFNKSGIRLAPKGG